MLCILVNNFSDMSWRFPVFLGWTSTKQQIKFLAQRHNSLEYSDSGESQTSNPSIPSLMLNQLSHWAPQYITIYIWAMAGDFQQCGMYNQQSLRSACAYASLCLSLEYYMSVKLLTEHNLEFLSLKGGCTGSSETTLVKMTYCWKSRVIAQIC